MKILKQGVMPNLNYRGSCGFCKTEIEAEPNEVKTDYYPREGTTWHTVQCPTCNKQIYVSKIDPRY